MRLPLIRGVIDRRMLVNFRVDPAIAATHLPPPFRPKLVNGHAMAGICLIRLRAVRPKWLPGFLGIGSENAAHRFAVEWDQDGQRREGVYIPRRDTTSRLNVFAGGRVFPGEQHFARFNVHETPDRLAVAFTSEDGNASVDVVARVAERLPAESLFGSLEAASQFFRAGALGYSARRRGLRLDGMELRCTEWSMQPLDVERVRSSYFDNRTLFPDGSIHFDCALLMRNVEHEWHAQAPICSVSQSSVRGNDTIEIDHPA